MRKGIFVVWAAAVVSLALIGENADAQEKPQASRAAAADGIVEIDVLDGSVAVTGWAKDAVQVTDEIGDADRRIELSGDERRTMVKVLGKGVREVALSVSVPKGSRVQVRGRSLKITISGVEGALDLEATNGNIAAFGAPSEVRVRTLAGDIELEVGATRVRAETTSGDISITGARGELSVRATSGDVKISGKPKGCGIACTSGNVVFDGELDEGSYRFESQSGTILLRLPAEVSAQFRAETVTGEIANQLGPEPKRKGPFTPGSVLDFVTGGGKAKVSISSTTGTIRLQKK